MSSAAVRGGATTRSELHVEVNGVELVDAVRRVTSLARLERGLTGATRAALRRGSSELREHLRLADWAWKASVELPRRISGELSTPWPHEPGRDELSITWSDGRAEVTVTSWSFPSDLSQRVTISASRAIVPARGSFGELSALMRALLQESDADLRLSDHDAYLALTNSGAIRARGATPERVGVRPTREAVFHLRDRRVVITVPVDAIVPEEPPTT